MAHLFVTCFAVYFGPTVQKKDSFQILLFSDNAPGYSRALVDLYEINVVLIPANIKSILQPIDQGKTSTFKS